MSLIKLVHPLSYHRSVYCFGSLTPEGRVQQNYCTSTPNGDTVVVGRERLVQARQKEGSGEVCFGLLSYQLPPSFREGVDLPLLTQKITGMI